MFSYTQLQAESKEWVAHNFKNRHPLEPVLGLFEEIGELHEHNDPPEEADAIADITIFAADACNGYGLNLGAIVKEASERSALTQSIIVTMGKLAHHALKDKQDIRGTHEEHVTAIGEQLVCLFEHVHAWSRARGIVLLPLVETTWKKVVQKRDWRPPVGHTTVDGPDPLRASTR
jgi:hypothetical protein